MSGRLRFTILGCGSSGGVPRADGVWGHCDPDEPKNRRSRCSMLVQRVAEQADGLETTLLVDTSPDLRYQTSAAEVRRLDAVLYTHDHADQAHGIDDLRVFFLTSRKRTALLHGPGDHGDLAAPLRLHLPDAQRLSRHLRSARPAAA